MGSVWSRLGSEVHVIESLDRITAGMDNEISSESLRGQETPLDITVEKAVELLASKNKTSSEIKTLGDHPKTGESLVVKSGRYGPYVSDGKVNASLKGDIGIGLINNW